MDKDFDLGVFIDKLSAADSLTEEHVKEHIQTNTALRLFFDNTKTLPEILGSCTLQDLEWAHTAILYWPSAEADLEIDDWNHEGVQYQQIYDFIKDLSSKESIRRKVTFI